MLEVIASINITGVANQQKTDLRRWFWRCVGVVGAVRGLWGAVEFGAVRWGDGDGAGGRLFSKHCIYLNSVAIHSVMLFGFSSEVIPEERML